MKRCYLMVYSDTLGTRDELKQLLNELPEVETWRFDLPHSFYLISEASAADLSRVIHERCGKRGRFLISEVSANRHGWLTPDSWYLFRNKAHKPKGAG